MMMTPSQLSRKTMTWRVAAELPHNEKVRYGEILGFILGDGSLSKRNNEISFVNSEPYCIERTLENFSLVFGIDKEDFHYYLTLPTICSHTEIISIWRQRLGNLKFKVSRYQKVKKKSGLLSVHINNKDIKCTLEEDIFNVLEEKEKNKEILLGFLKGFFAAEGAIIPGKTTREIPNSIQFPQKGRKIPESISRILWYFGVENRVVIKQKKADYYCVNITGFENYKKLHTLDIASLHPEKAEKIEKALSAYTKIVSRKLKLPIKLLRTLNEKPMTRSEIYEFMGFYPQKINGMLYSKTSYLVKNKLILKNISENGIILWQITDAGRDFLKSQE